ncbi:MAG: SDR family oxidoreductase [Oscillospiraceae bacterium]|nr:SDR family oxidoreductase [Oscillospiraceae bacterium]
MDLGLKNKVAVVTGGTLGIGLATARILAREGATVVICGRSQDKLDAAIAAAKEEGILLQGKTADVTDEASFAAFSHWVWSEFGRVDILVNNAGRGSPGAALSLEKEVWQNVLDTNLTSVWNCSKVISPYMERSGGGAIVNVSSLSGRIAFTHQGAYPVSKAGVNALTRVMASELAAKNIRVVAVAPGFTETEMLKKKYGDTSFLTDTTILHRLAKPEEIGQLIAFLASDLAGYITAEVVEISGGAFQVRDPGWSWDRKND